MERNTGIRSILGNARVYQLFQYLVGAKKGMDWLKKNHFKVREGMVVVDIGCGPARLRQVLPDEITYYGFDPNSDYIDIAGKNCDGEFMAGVMPDFLERYGEELNGKVDVILCSGVLHHLTPEQMTEILEGAVRLLKEGGRFCALEPSWLARQDRLSRWVLSQDRGTNILYDYEWRKTMEDFFDVSEVRVINRLIRIPYMYALLTGWKGGQ